MGSQVGTLIGSLENYSIATNIYIPGTTTLGANGNFIYCFANSTNSATDANGYIFYGANANRYAITKRHYSSESAVQSGTRFEQGSWKNLIYTQDGTQGSIFIDGELLVTGPVTLLPKEIGNTPYNFLGRSSYTGDVYLATYSPNYSVNPQAL